MKRYAVIEYLVNILYWLAVLRTCHERTRPSRGQGTGGVPLADVENGTLWGETVVSTLGLSKMREQIEINTGNIIVSCSN